ncbi:deoxycytidylate deaminase [Aspergillus sclerotioniger CBS 115572]|uniref:Deoxycytidylate deaminase n=1 Tax=Aspergillus sclerotioniger CBS 115572 TaxID=1450535 RepID=A0A317V4F5_9EURO|nr:deoxycytidylate deaminase [Aspergillus sclerotioniger CBS 115572]PWY69164.1 deoxycytidylate deaminase [Aspergillus sclerotioniger CBS 115572]
MLIGLCGAICSGKHSVANYLIQEEGFRLLKLKDADSPQVTDEPDGDRQQQALESAGNESSPSSQLVFDDSKSLLDFVTKRWQGLWVTTDIRDITILDRFLQRPFFLLVSVDAPMSLRWKRHVDRPEPLVYLTMPLCHKRLLESPSLEEFVLWNDKNLYEKGVGRAYFTDGAQVRLFNSSSSLKELHAALKSLRLADEQRLRPNWDQYFMELASLASQRSNCMKRRVGCVLVRDRRVISTGYNGTPRHIKNCNEGGCPRCNRGEGGGLGLSTCLCLHAEENALLEAGRERIREGAILYCDTCPCLTCTVKIAQVGISEVVYSQGYNMDNDSAAILNSAGVKLRQFSPPRNGLVYLENSENPK